MIIHTSTIDGNITFLLAILIYFVFSNNQLWPVIRKLPVYFLQLHFFHIDQQVNNRHVHIFFSTADLLMLSALLHIVKPFYVLEVKASIVSRRKVCYSWLNYFIIPFFERKAMLWDYNTYLNGLLNNIFSKALIPEK